MHLMKKIMGMAKKSYKSDNDILESYSEKLEIEREGNGEGFEVDSEIIRMFFEQLEIEGEGGGEGFEADSEYSSESECDSETFSEWISRREERIY